MQPLSAQHYHVYKAFKQKHRTLFSPIFFSHVNEPLKTLHLCTTFCSIPAYCSTFQALLLQHNALLLNSLKLHFFQFSLPLSNIKVLFHLPPPLYLDYSDKMFFIFLTWFTLISQPHNNRIYSAAPESRELLQHEQKAQCLQMGFPRQGSVKLNISGSTTAENRYFRV